MTCACCDGGGAQTRMVRVTVELCESKSPVSRSRAWEIPLCNVCYGAVPVEDVVAAAAG